MSEYKLPVEIANFILLEMETDFYDERFESVEENYVIPNTVNVSMAHINHYEDFITLQYDYVTELKVKALDGYHDYEELYQIYTEDSQITGNQSNEDIYFFKNETELNKFIDKNRLMTWGELTEKELKGDN